MDVHGERDGGKEGTLTGKGRLYGVGVGPGDPELITLRAMRVLREADWIAAPKVGNSARAALRVAEPYIKGKPVLDCATPMTRDEAARARAHDAIAKKIAELLDAGLTVAFVTLGDASVYSTWSYVCERMEGRGYEIEVVPGVTSFSAAAATLHEPLCIGSERLLVVPASAENPSDALDEPGTKVFMKAGRALGGLRDALAARGCEADANLVANCGLPGQTVMRGLPSEGALPGYMSLVIVRDGRGKTAGISGDSAFDVRPQEAHPCFQELAAAIEPPDEEARMRSLGRWNGVAKPIGGLGVLEDDVSRIAALIASEEVCLEKRAVAVLCADNGVVAQGVSQCGQEVTAAVAGNIARRASSVCVMAKTAQMDVLAYDMGIAAPPAVAGLIDRHVARGTRDISLGPAMSREQAVAAVRTGISIAGELKRDGYDIIAAGEMGIGNSTTSSAIASVLLDVPLRQVVGRGAGLSDAGLARKLDVVERAIEVNHPDPADALDVLAKLGGLDIAGLAGLFIGGAIHRVPVIVDGFISAVSAYLAMRLVPSCTCAMLASHVSAEPAARLLLDRLGLQPAIQAGMRLGEGTGAVCLVPLLDAALALYDGTTFEETGIDAYEVEPGRGEASRSSEGGERG